MARLFISLYLGIIGSIFALFFMIEVLGSQWFMDVDLEDTRQETLGYIELLQDIHELGGQERMEAAMQRTAELNNLIHREVTDPELLGKTELQTLASPGVLVPGILDEDLDPESGESVFFRMNTSDTIYQVYPDQNSAFWRADELMSQIFFWSFFLILAVTLGIWAFLLQRKLKMLEDAAMRISEGDFSVRAPNKPRYRVGGLNKAFNLMAERVEQLLASHKRLTNAVAHELRTPIFRLRCQLELMEHGIERDEHEIYAKGMDEDLTELDQLVDELLSYARMERSGIELQLSQQDLSRWLEQQWPTLARSCRKPLALEMGEPISLRFDTHLLMRALNNLVRNADNYAQQQIEIRFYRDQDYVVVCVDDDGCGIPEADRERVLQPFERLDDARTRQTGGHGLGLSIVREIVQQHQGRLLILESPMGGTRVALYLPLT